jgi:hypothetical protein
MSTALILVDPKPEEEQEHEACLQIASFAAAALVAEDAPEKRKRVALLASPADALEILLAVWGVRGRTGPLEKRSTLVLLPPLLPRNGDTAQQSLMLRHDPPGMGTIDDLERAGVFTYSETPSDSPASTLQGELRLPGSRKILVFGGRPELWALLGEQPDVIAFGQEARAHRGVRLIEDLAERVPTSESFDESDDAEFRYGVRLGRQIAAVLGHLEGH